MLVRSRATRNTLLLGLAAFGLLAWFYATSLRHLSAARLARRSDDCAAAEAHLSACWQLPGLRDPLALEEHLLGVQQGDLTDEESWQTRVDQSQTDGPLIREALAKGNLATFKFNEARGYADQILERQPAHAQALWVRGQAWVRVQQETKAREDFERALELEPQAREIRLSLAELLHKLGYTREAESHYFRLRETRPSDERVVAGLAHCRQEEGRLDEARNLLDGLLKAQPKSIVGLVEQGRLALRLGQPEDGERWLRQAAELSPDNARTNFVLRLCLEAPKKTDEALQRRMTENDRRQATLRLKLHESPRDPVLLTELGQWMLQTGDQRDAAGWFFLALKEDPRYVPAHAGLARYFSKVGQKRRARVHARMAGAPFSDSQDIAAVHRSIKTAIAPLHELPPVREASSEEVHRLCAACHAYPPPETMPRVAWRKEVKQGFDLLRDSTLSGDFPPLESVVQYYERRAPERLPTIEQTTAISKPPVRFETKGAGWIANLPPYPGVANVNLVPLNRAGGRGLLACDTRLDRVMVLKPNDPSPAWQFLPHVIAPCHTSLTDLDGDGRRDILVACLGEFFPTDDPVGSVVLLRGKADGTFEPITLLDGIGRVSDVQAADFSGDGQLDLVVAVFGSRKTGEVLYLENRTTDWSRPQFSRHVVDARHGAIHVPVVDLNGDHKPDFIALISQEHETVVANLNKGDGIFRQETVFAAPHPTYGSSGIEVVDLDGDGDSDVLLTNGDVLDRPYLLKPYHGVQWLENEGTYPFKHNLLSPMYGASQAVAADFDGDQDLDVVAVSFLPRLEFPEREQLRLPSVMLLEQTSRGQFTPHVLETGACDHFSCAAGDIDADGRIDLALSNFSWKRSDPFADAAVLWRNLGGR